MNDKIRTAKLNIFQRSFIAIVFALMLCLGVALGVLLDEPLQPLLVEITLATAPVGMTQDQIDMHNDYQSALASSYYYEEGCDSDCTI